MTRTIQEQLVEKGIAKTPKEEQKHKRSKKQTSTKLSKREIEELMGIRRPTYRRKNGAFRQS